MTRQIPRFRGPSLMLLVLAHILMFAAGLISAIVLRHGASYVTPFASAERVRSFFEQNPMATRVSNFFLFGSAAPFGIFAATIVSRLRFYGVRAAGTNMHCSGECQLPSHSSFPAPPVGRCLCPKSGPQSQLSKRSTSSVSFPEVSSMQSGSDSWLPESP